jgi:hypothetical protein
VGEANWRFKTSFDAGELEDEVDLVFEGLDTYCEITLVRPSPLFRIIPWR